eukprot:COSAG05_NODE_50_length_24118_cov_89.534036_13_plen_142_part_00
MSEDPSGHPASPRRPAELIARGRSVVGRGGQRHSRFTAWVLRMWAGRQVVGGGGGRQRLEYRLYASLVAICRRHLRPPCPLSPPRASLRSLLAIVQRGALRRKTSTESALLRQFGGGTCWGESFSRFPLARHLFYGSCSAA